VIVAKEAGKDSSEDDFFTEKDVGTSKTE